LPRSLLVSELDSYEVLYLGWALFFHVVLIVHFSLRKWFFDSYVMKYGWVVYALAGPAVVVSILIFSGGKPWSLWLGGVIYLLWATYGYVVEYVRRTEWRSPVRWGTLGPYVLLYLATVMFYWWPAALVSPPLWYVLAVLFVVSTILNVSSHRTSRIA
jgi:hypothetical protein